jgi:hypothetical protein
MDITFSVSPWLTIPHSSDDTGYRKETIQQNPFINYRMKIECAFRLLKEDGDFSRKP